MFKPLKRIFANFNFQATFATCLVARLAVSLAIAAPRVVVVIGAACVVVSVAKLIKKLIRP
jgi:hypothetical protein